MNLTIYVPANCRKALKEAKKAAKQRRESVSKVAMDAILAYGEKYPIIVTTKEKK